MSESDFKSSAAFKLVKAELDKNGADIVKKVKGTYLFKVKNKAGQQASWFLDAKAGAGSLTFGSDKKADCTVSMSDDDLNGLMTGKVNAQKAFMQGKLKLSGNMALAMKLKDILPSPPKSKL